MNGTRVFITGMGVMSPLGCGVDELYISLKKNRSGIKPLTLFSPSEGNLLPAGEVFGFDHIESLPRTHALALAAMNEALAGRKIIPDAIIIGTTTGGMPLTEELLKSGETDPSRFHLHSTSSVAEYLARETSCHGLILTVTTACSSGSVAILLARELLLAGKAKRVLAGGADALCRLTYYGFNSLQVIDPDGARPLDRARRGMTVAEGSAILLLEAADSAPDGAIAEILGGGLSCDAHHPAHPHPEGAGALAAMKRACETAGITPAHADYINLHGTGTIDNDIAEARAVRALYSGKDVPALSSIKGATGHSLAASGAIEAVVSALCIREGFVPANTGCTEPDPELGVRPVLEPQFKKISAVLSNSLGFGGNNACLVLGAPGAHAPADPRPASFQFEVLGSACFTGAGDIEQTVRKLRESGTCAGVLPLADISKNLPAREVRRLKRLPRMALALALDARDRSGTKPESIYFGTAWGPLSETHDFLTKLFESNEQFTSPTDFVGSVHNAPAGQAAIWLKATGANITTTGGDYSFEQSLFSAALYAVNETVLVIGADEHHEVLSPVFDGSVRIASAAADGGGALCLRKTGASSGTRISPLFFGKSNPSVIESLVGSLGGPETIRRRYGALFAGIPAAARQSGGKQLDEFITAAGVGCPVVDYRPIIGEFASAASTAAALAARFITEGAVPAALTGGPECPLAGTGILLLGFGEYLTATEILA